MNKDISDSELISLLPEDEENVKNIIYERYHYLMDVIIKKYSSVIKTFQIDEDDIKCEASYGFSDGINSFSESKNASLKTFLSLCIERRVRKCIDKYTTVKAKVFKDALSLDYQIPDGPALSELVSDEKNSVDPLDNLTSLETYMEIISKAKEVLSEFEYHVFCYMINDISYHDIAKKMEKTPKQIDNTIQRIKIKMRKELQNIK